jgi:micrococcal nuclease
MKKFLIFFLFFINFSFAELYNWKVIKVVDGDTLQVQADFLPKELGNKILIRIWGVDTPEKGWRAASDREREMALKTTEYTTNLVKKSKDIKIKIISWDKYGGRILGDVIIDGQSLKDLLLANGYAREYYGEKKTAW